MLETGSIIKFSTHVKSNTRGRVSGLVPWVPQVVGYDQKSRYE
jgi:hypothetical protein